MIAEEIKRLVGENDLYRIIYLKTTGFCDHRLPAIL